MSKEKFGTVFQEYQILTQYSTIRCISKGDFFFKVTSLKPLLENLHKMVSKIGFRKLKMLEIKMRLHIHLSPGKIG